MPRNRFAALCLALLTAACTTPTAVEPPGTATVYVVGRGWHTDIALPVEEITGPLASLEAEFPGVRVLTFGFGERQFLVNHEKDLGSMLYALLPSRSALLMTALNTSPQAAFGASNVVTLHVSQAGLDRIEASIWREFERSATGQPVKLADGPYPGSVFYAASDTYDGFHTCNTWTADTLRTGGVPMSAAGVLFAGQVMGPARWIQAHQAASP
ncbi:MAG TPA: DUF2459 domain-containing protein [Rhodopila sp.]|jgi:uncharacterized protein (TIGR02117 family)